MSQHSQRTQHGPSLASIATGGVLTLASATAVAYVLTGEITSQQLVGSILGTGLTLLLAGQTLGRHADRLVAQDRIRREEDRAAQRAEEVAVQRRINTGTWRGDNVGQELTVWWDPAARRYFLSGWLGDHWQTAGETPWTADLESLAGHLTELERSGELEPLDDEGTRMVRASLDLPGWDEAATQPDPPREELDPGDTGVITYTDTGLPRRPVGETLRSIDTARFRD